MQLDNNNKATLNSCLWTLNLLINLERILQVQSNNPFEEKVILYIYKKINQAYTKFIDSRY